MECQGYTFHYGKAFGTLVRQLRLQQGYSLRELAGRVGLLPNFLSNMERGHFPPPGEQKIVLIAEILEQNTDELLALAGKVSSDLIEIILQRPKETAALLRRLRHVPASKIAAAKDQLAATEPLEFYPLETVSGENHTAMVGESGSGKSLLTKYLIHSYFRDAHVRVLRCTSLSRQVEAKIKIGCYAYEPKYTAAGVW